MENIIVAVFEIESEAYQGFSQLKREASSEKSLITQMVLVKEEDGHAAAMERYDSGRDSRNDTIIGGLIGGVIGVLAGPLGVVIGGSIGMMVGETVEKDEAIKQLSMVEYIAGHLEDGESAVIILAQEEDEAVIDEELAGFAVRIMRWDAAAVQVEVEEANQLEENMVKQLRKEIKERKSRDRKEKINGYKQKIKQEFEDIRRK